MSSAIERSLKNIRSELEFLRDEKFLKPEQYQDIANVLSTLPSQSNSQGRPPAQAPDSKQVNKTVYAMYDWQGHEASDMSLCKGDKIEVLEQLNNDWWKGKTQSAEGIFPSNFVSESPQFSTEKSEQHSSGGYIAPPSNFDEKQTYQQPPPNYYGAQAQQQPPQGNYYGAPQQQQYYQPQGQNQGQPAFVQQQVQEQQHHQGGGHLKKFGSKFGNAAIWGAGATLGSDLINSIF